MMQSAITKIKEEWLNEDGSVNLDRPSSDCYGIHYLEYVEDIREATQYEISRPLWENYQKLTPKQQEAVTLLVMGKTQNEVAEAVNVERHTLVRWMQIEVFRDCHNLWIKYKFEETKKQLNHLQKRAIEELEKMLDEKDQIPPHVYLKVIELCLK